MGKHSNKDAFIVKVLTFFKLLWTIVDVDLTGTFLSLDGRHSNIEYWTCNENIFCKKLGTIYVYCIVWNIFAYQILL